MTRNKRLLFSKAFLMALFALPFAAGEALAHDRHHHGRGHGHGHHGHNDNDRPQQQCRQIVQEFRISDFFTYSETGTACRDYNGVWQVISDTRYPNLYGQVYFVDRGRREYFGEVSPRPHPYKRGHDYGNNYRERDHDYRHNHGNDRNYDYLDKKNHRNR